VAVRWRFRQPAKPGNPRCPPVAGLASSFQLPIPDSHNDMSDSLTIYRLLKKDPRYPIEAYQFVREGLSYATNELNMGSLTRHGSSSKPPTESDVPDLQSSSDDFESEIDLLAQQTKSNSPLAPTPSPSPADATTAEDAADASAEEEEEDDNDDETVAGRHLSGQELCEALRKFALHQYGLLAKSVLEQWGIRSTSDFGSIVYNMIDIGLMRKSPEDRREHFDHCYDFQEAFVEQFEIQPETKSK